MNLNQLQYFVVLARYEHYTKAAEELEISQPSLSHAMATLERELGTRLFQKKGRNVVLTKYGRMFREYVEEALKILDLGIRKTREMTGQTSGVIELAYIYTLGNAFVPRLVGDFIRSHEELNVKFHFHAGTTKEIIKGLKEEKYDLALCSMVEEEKDVTFTPVGTQKLVVVVPKAHPLAGRKGIDLEEAADYPIIYFGKNSGLRAVVDKLFEMAHIRPKIVCEVEEDGSMAGLVAENFGIAIMPDLPVLKTMDVDILEIRSPQHQRYIYLATAKKNYLPPLAEKFAGYIKKVRVL